MTEKNDTTIIAGKLLEAAVRELKLYNQLAELFRHQARAVGLQDTEQLMKVVAVKQSVLQRIDALQAVTGPYKTDWAGRSGRFTPEARQQIEGVFRKVGQLLEEILRAEGQGPQVLEQRRVEMVGRMRHMDQTRRAAKAYGTGKPTTGAIGRQG